MLNNVSCRGTVLFYIDRYCETAIIDSIIYDRIADGIVKLDPIAWDVLDRIVFTNDIPRLIIQVQPTHINMAACRTKRCAEGIGYEIVGYPAVSVARGVQVRIGYKGVYAAVVIDHIAKTISDISFYPHIATLKLYC